MSEPHHTIFAIGDIHGCNSTLRALLERLPINKDSDTLIFMGDYINRGPDSRKVLDTLIAVQSHYAHTVFLKGNHEHLLLEYAAGGDVEMLRVLRNMGVEATLESYGATVRELPELSFMPPEHREFLRSLSLSHTDERYIFVHADTDEVELGEAARLGTLNPQHASVQLDRALSSRRLVREHTTATGDAVSEDTSNGVADNRIVVFAHAPFETPLVMPDRICVDTGAAYGNMLTAVELPAVRFYYA